MERKNNRQTARIEGRLKEGRNRKNRGERIKNWKEWDKDGNSKERVARG